jgi:adenylate kinase family enzyme
MHDAVLERRLADHVAGLASPGPCGECRLEDTGTGTRRAIGTRISVVGASGSGKSHVSRILGEILNLPVSALDALRDSLPGGKSDTREFARHAEILVSRDAWIIDGHYSAIRHLIWRRADTVILLNYPLYIVFIQLIGRYIKKKLGRLRLVSRTDFPASKEAGASQRWHRLLKTFRERQDYARTLRSPEYGKTIVIELTSRQATRDWLKSLRAEG